MKPLLLSKLTRPNPQPHWVPRPRLFARLDEGLHKKASFISAPAGFGKTTLFSQWLDQKQAPAAWLSLDERDNDPVRFMRYLAAALEAALPGVSMPDVGDSAQAFDLLTIQSLLVNALDQVEEDLFLVIDDYHLIQNNAIHRMLDFLLEHLSPCIHLVLLSRADPPLRLTRLRTQGELLEMRMDDLRFTLQETSAFFTRGVKLSLHDYNADRLNARTEGWIAGLQLAAVSMKGKQDIDAFIHSFSGSNKYVLDYLIEEVFQLLSPEMQHFLTATSILARFNGSLCDHLLGNAESQEVIEELEKNNLFVVPLDDRREWYRYHTLFAELLQKRLYASGRRDLPNLHQRAGEWYEQHDMDDWAVEHFANAGDLRNAARLIEKQADGLWSRGEQNTLTRWLEMLPDEVVRGKPRLAIYQSAMLCMSGHLAQAETWLDDAQAALGEENRHLLGMVEGLRARLAYFNHDWEAIHRHARRALDLLPEGDVMTRGGIVIILGEAFILQGKLEEAERVYLDALSRHLVGNKFLVLATSVNLVSALVNQGKLRRAHDACEHYLVFAADAGLGGSVWAASLYAFQALILSEWGSTREALSAAYKGLQITEEHRHVLMQSFCWFSLVRVEYYAGRRDEAENALRKLSLLDENHDLPRWVGHRIHAWKIRLDVPGTDYPTDIETLDALLENLEREDFSLLLSRIEEFLSISRRQLQGGEPVSTRTLAYLERLSGVTDEVGAQRLMIEASLLLARAYWKHEDVTAFECLARAVSLAEGENYLQLFINEGEAMARLLYRYVEERGRQPFVGAVLEAYAQRSEVRPEPDDYIEPLTEREVEVLRLIAAGRSNAEIAAALFVSVYTVKAHARNIYTKLLVGSRMEAVSKAREFGVIE